MILAAVAAAEQNWGKSRTLEEKSHSQPDDAGDKTDLTLLYYIILASRRKYSELHKP